MARVCLSAAVICAQWIQTAAFYETGSNVHGLKRSDDFKRWVTNSSFLVMAEFYREGCGFCALLTEQWEKAATDLKHLVHFVGIDVEKDRALSNKVIQKYGIKVEGVPTIVGFMPNSKQPIVYNGERKAGAIKTWATNTMPDFVKRLKQPEDFEAWADYADDQTRRIVLFSEKASVAALMKAISSEFRGRVRFGLAVKDTFSRLAKEYGVQSYPTLVALRRPADDFEDDSWVQKYFGEKQFASLSLATGPKPTFRSLEGWAMTFARAPRDSKRPQKRRRAEKSGEL
eukprot:TRINITY_DN73239_c0_g1_i1.p1 TRINITY_DN73239_c0_g1~~TRINITY_DN73239_c0_g1_i1.p1  ORF type:complete len:329 (+),score=51.72 TRINITY_DN73239_c0_g1_i1:131-988(+)